MADGETNACQTLCWVPHSRPLARVTMSALKRALWALSPRLFDRVVAAHRGQTFSIGIREGACPLRLEDGAGNPVLTKADVTDVPAAFVADPFMIPHEGGWLLFMEVFDRTCRSGRIGLAESPDGRTWQYRRVVLKEPFHLAYPSLLKWNGEVYMLPDSPGHGARLYRATRFPFEWSFERLLVDDRGLSDSTLVEYDGRWWLFAGRAGARGEPMSLCLYHAESPLGPWRPHPGNPLVHGDDTRARPGGNFIRLDGRLIRLAQVGVPAYGHRLQAFVVDELSVDRYRETPLSDGPVLGPGSEAWNCGGMHHMDAHCIGPGRWIACVDGWCRTSPGPSG